MHIYLVKAIEKKHLETMTLKENYTIAFNFKLEGEHVGKGQENREFVVYNGLQAKWLQLKASHSTSY